METLTVPPMPSLHQLNQLSVLGFDLTPTDTTCCSVGAVSMAHGCTTSLRCSSRLGVSRWDELMSTGQKQRRWSAGVVIWAVAGPSRLPAVCVSCRSNRTSLCYSFWTDAHEAVLCINHIGHLRRFHCMFILEKQNKRERCEHRQTECDKT
jgi:hypothetical protein